MNETRTIPLISTELRHEGRDELGFIAAILVDDGRLFATGGHANSPTILRSTDGGKTFESRPTPRCPGLRRMVRVGGMLAITGEYGTLAVSDDDGFTWTPLPLPTEACLSGLVEDGAGTRWVMGDSAFVARAERGSWEFLPVQTSASCRFLNASIVGGRLVLLGNDGNLWWSSGATLEPKHVFDGSLNAMIETKSGALIIAANDGGILRSEDRGVTFTAIATHTTENIEDVIATERGIFAGGAEGVLFFSDDDGKTFVPVDGGIDSTVWCFAPVPGGVLIGSDNGAIYELSVSATETMEVELREASADDKADDEEDEDEDEDTGERADEDGAKPATFASIDEASARWVKEGRAFSTALNAYVDRVYAVGVNKAGPEPSDTREDMADYVREQLAALNAKGEHRRARELFPPAYEPFTYEPLGREVNQIKRLADGRTIVRVDADVYVVERDRITSVPDVTFFAMSPDRRFVAKGYDDRIDVHEGWDGAKLRTIPLTPKLRNSTSQVHLTADGDALLLAGEGGIFWVSEGGSRLLMPEGRDDDEISLSYPHAALSPNGRFVALGCQDSSHELIDRKTGTRHRFNTVSSYPHFAMFHDSRPEVLFNSVHGLYGSGSVLANVDEIATNKGEQVRLFDRRSWLFSAAPLTDAYLLGDRGGYVWCIGVDGKQRFYLFLGSSLTAMDVTPDKKTLLVGSIAGYVIEIDLTAPGRDPMLLTNGNVKETARWIFWRGHDPMIW